MAEDEMQTFSVPEISCEHCVSAITTEVNAVAGVTTLAIDLDAKLVTVSGGDRAAIIAAIDEAGYDVA